MRALGGFSKRALEKRKGKKANQGILNIVQEMIPPRKTIIDIGAGIGQFVTAIRDMNRTCDGIDGSQDVEQVTDGLVRYCDLSKPIPFAEKDWRSYDWALFIEVGEHVPEEFEDQVVKNVSRLASAGLVLSWAVPGQRGRGHVNCRTPEYVASIFGEYGWRVDEQATKRAKELAGRFFRNRIMILRR